MENVNFHIRKIYDLIQAYKSGRYSVERRELDQLNSHCYYNLVENYTYIFNNPDKHSPDAHANFLKRIQEEGWIYGEHRDTENKLEPWCVPYSNLSDEQKLIWTVGYINTTFLTTHKSAEAKN